MNDNLGGGMPPLIFYFNAILALAVPLALAAGMVAAITWLARAFQGPSSSRLTVRGMMVAVLLLGLELGVGRWWLRYNFETVYATGYNEGQFRRIRIGMTTNEVESILGLPLRKDSTSPRWGSYENWIYSDPPPTGTIGDNYWRRWVMFKGGQVAVIVEDYYVD